MKDILIYTLDRQKDEQQTSWSTSSTSTRSSSCPPPSAPLWRGLSPFSESLPILFLRRWNYLEMFFAASRERMLYHPNATAILKVWPLSVQCTLCINNIFPTEQTIGKLDYQLWSIFSCCSRTSINIQSFFIRGNATSSRVIYFKLCINDIFPTDVMHKSTRQQYTCVSKNLSL